MDATLPALMQWVPLCDPKWSEPWHLRELVDELEAAPHGSKRTLVGCPIRHYKTSTVHAAIAKWLRVDPTLRIIYMTYSIGRATEMGKEIRDLCRRMGVHRVKEYDTIASWRTEEHGGVDVMSAQQSRLGADVDILVIDDPFESPEEAERPEVRDAVDKTIEHYTMRLSRGGSVVLVMSRFHVDDAIGRRVARQNEKWTYVHKRAIGDDGNALAPSVRTVEEMLAIRAALQETDPDERLWWSQWQNDPRPPGSDLFGTPARYETFPQGGYRIAYGVDFAYTEGVGSDFFAAVAARVYGRKVYLLDVRRAKLDAVHLEDTCRVLLAEHGRAPLWSYQSGPEIGLSRLLLQRGVPIGSMPARYNKLVRAQKTIRRWNDGDVLVPATATWAHGFLHRVSLFRGHEREHDDEVDALVSMVDAVLGGGGEPPQVGLGGRQGKAYAGMLG